MDTIDTVCEHHDTLCAAVPNPDPSTDWSRKLEDVWNEHGFVEKGIWQPENCNSFGAYYQHPEACSDVSEWAKCIIFDERMIFMSTFNDIAKIKKGNSENVFVQFQRGDSICDRIQARTLVLLGVRKYARTLGYSRIADG